MSRGILEAKYNIPFGVDLILYGSPKGRNGRFKVGIDTA